MAGKLIVFPTTNGKYSFNLKAANGEVILSASTTFDNEALATAGAEAVRAAALSPIADQTKGEALEGARFELYQDKSGEFRFRLVDAEGANIGKSESYKAKTSARKGIASVGRNAPTAALVVEKAE